MHNKICEETQNLLNILLEYSGKPVDIDKYSKSITVDIIGRVIFGESFDALKGKENKLLEQVDALTNISQTVTGERLQFLFKYFTISNAVASLKKAMMPYINKRKVDPDRFNKHDLLSVLMQTDNKLSDSQIVRELYMMVFAGHETTAHSISFTLYLISKHLKIQMLAQEEIDKVIGDKTIPDVEDIDKLEFLGNVILESMRVYTVAPLGSGRQMTKDTEICEYTIYTGTEVTAAGYSINHSPENYPNPDEFNPNRYLDLNTPKPYTFATGPRTCIALNLAKREMKTIIGAILKNYNVILPEPDKFECEVSMSLKPKNLMLKFEKRIHK